MSEYVCMCVSVKAQHMGHTGGGALTDIFQDCWDFGWPLSSQINFFPPTNRVGLDS